MKDTMAIEFMWWTLGNVFPWIIGLGILVVAGGLVFLAVMVAIGAYHDIRDAWRAANK